MDRESSESGRINRIILAAAYYAKIIPITPFTIQIAREKG
jgi:hypothetical protein